MNTKQLEEASASYYAGNPIITDAEFDQAVIDLKKNNPDHPFLKRVGAPVPSTQKAKHKIPMGSLSNANNEKEFRNWIPDYKPTILLTHKMDGSSLELIYDDGHFVQAITRGDGDVGEDVTRNVLLSNHFPLTVHQSIISVRCECLIHKDDWDEHFVGDANPRNSAAGTLRRHDGENAHFLRFYAFDALFDTDKMDINIDRYAETECGILSLLRRYFQIPFYALANDSESLVAWCKEVESIRETHPYEIDGVVAKIDDRVVSKSMGVRDGRPKGQIAIKFKPRGGETILQRVIWQVGQTGALTPVGEVSPVGVGGVIVRRATLCNMNEIRRLGIAIGDTIEVIRSGDVTPKILRLVKADKHRQIIPNPVRCPICGWEVAYKGVILFCTNKHCKGRTLGRIMTWVKKRNILNLGISVIEAAELKSISHLYKMETKDWADIQVLNGRYGLKRAIKVTEALNKSRLVTLPDFLGSIGIKGIGRTLSRVLCDSLELKTIYDAFSVLPDQIEGLDGFGPTRAYDFCDWISDNSNEIQELSSIMNFENVSGDNIGAFYGEIICFTGKSPKPRSEMSRLAEEAGASVSSSVKSDTTILVIADTNSTSSKAIKARKLGVKLISPEDFLGKVVH